MKYLKPSNYEEFIEILKRIPSQKQQLEYLFEYFKREVKYNYDVLAQAKTIKIYELPDGTITKYGSDALVLHRITGKLDKAFNCVNLKEREKAVRELKSGMESIGLPLSDEFIGKILEKYGQEYIIPAQPERPANGIFLAIHAQPERKEFRTLQQSAYLIDFPAEYENGLITKGVCADYAPFINRVCKEIDIFSVRIDGNTPTDHVWNLIESDGEKKHFDITYALFVRDKYSDWDKKAKFDDFLGLSFDRLKELNPLRNIETIDGKPLQSQERTLK